MERLGSVAYPTGLSLQRDLVARRRGDQCGDTLLLLEHPHVITFGSSGCEDHILADEGARAELGIELHRVGRGGDVTYHGPGQLVGYPILRLSGASRDLHGYLRALEECLIEALRHFGIEGGRSPEYTGVWVEDRKIAAIGVRVSSGWITSHGFALNVDPDLGYFDTIVPCGIEGREVTSISRELGRAVTVEEAIPPVVEAFRVRMDGEAGFRVPTEALISGAGDAPVTPAVDVRRSPDNVPASPAAPPATR